MVILVGLIWVLRDKARWQGLESSGVLSTLGADVHGGVFAWAFIH